MARGRELKRGRPRPRGRFRCCLIRACPERCRSRLEADVWHYRAIDGCQV